MSDGYKIFNTWFPAASKLNFIISWTELHQLPKNPDGTLKTSKLEGKEDCGFLCPGQQGICIERNLVCNGIQNCPNTTGIHDESEDQCKLSDSHFVLLNHHLNISWITASLVGGAGALFICLICVCLCRCCCSGRRSGGKRGAVTPPEEDYLTWLVFLWELGFLLLRISSLLYYKFLLTILNTIKKFSRNQILVKMGLSFFW